MLNDDEYAMIHGRIEDAEARGKLSLKLYVFETIQPDHIFAVISEDEESARKTVEEYCREKLHWNGKYRTAGHEENGVFIPGVWYTKPISSDMKLTIFGVGKVYHPNLTQPHVMGG